MYIQIHRTKFSDSLLIYNLWFTQQTATDIAEFNITAMMHELVTGEKYSLPDEDKKPKVPEKATITEIIEEEDEEEEEEEVGHGECKAEKTQDNEKQAKGNNGQ